MDKIRVWQCKETCCIKLPFTDRGWWVQAPRLSPRPYTTFSYAIRYARSVDRWVDTVGPKYQARVDPPNTFRDMDGQLRTKGGGFFIFE